MMKLFVLFNYFILNCFRLEVEAVSSAPRSESTSEFKYFCTHRGNYFLYFSFCQYKLHSNLDVLIKFLKASQNSHKLTGVSCSNLVVLKLYECHLK